MTPEELRLRDENETLREEVRQLRALLVVERALPAKWKLTESESVVVRTLVPREIATKEQIMNALYSHKPNDVPDPKIISVLIFKIRKKLEGHRVQISTIWGRGYSLDPATRAEILEKADVRNPAPQKIERGTYQDGGRRRNLHQAG